MNRSLLPSDLPALWRERAETLSTYGDPNTSRLWKIAANELEGAMELSAVETLSLADASRVCGYSSAYLSALIKRGTIPNAGRNHAPRIRRQDLPPNKQPGGRGRPAHSKKSNVPSSDTIRSIASSHHRKEKK